MSSAPDEHRQMTFEEVCELEHVRGDAEYTAWLAAGKPVLEEEQVHDTPMDA